MASMQRLMANLFGDWFQLRRRFPAPLLDEMAANISAGERHHLGEVCFAVESRLAPLAVLDGLNARKRAEHVFAQLGVWNTEQNCGVLFYILLAEHRIEIVADRGIAGRVTSAEWDTISRRMLHAYAQGRWREGSLDGIAAAHALLTMHFPSDGADHRDELPDRPVLL